ncbi:hypothetical protein RHDC4_00037 [Rhodocyclaceae bacterium]|nr:hypothetical protein RHDC4_00037 [Rhodocyclaceae bacterium]
MKVTYDVDARKRPVNLTLNEDLVVQARALTENLSGVVETLLAGYVQQEHQARLSKAKAIDTTVAMWNDFNARRGSFADEFSTL